MINIDNEETKLDLPLMLKPTDIQNHLGISKNKTYNLIQLKGFPKIQIGNQYFIPYEEYLKWLKKNIGSTISV